MQVARQPSLGVETSTGQAWVGVDQQVGHGSADAIFALSDEQYVELLMGHIGTPYLGECWRGEHEDKCLFRPGGDSWNPARWFSQRIRTISPPFEGELWRHIDALGEPEDGRSVEISRALAANSAVIETGFDGVAAMSFRLAGDGTYPRKAALIAGLTEGSTREQAREILGAAKEGTADEFDVEGARLRLNYEDGGLAAISLERSGASTPPSGQIGAFLDVLGKQEAGLEYQAVARLSGDTSRRWAAGSASPRFLIAFDGGVEIQVADDRVLEVRIVLRSTTEEPIYGHPHDLIEGLRLPAPRSDVRRVIGGPDASSGRKDLYQYGRRMLVIEYRLVGGQEISSAMTTVLSGVTVWPKFHRWRSGDLTRFLDILGRGPANPLVEYVRGLPGVRVGMSDGVVAKVEIGTSGYQTERFAAFIDGMSPQPTRKDIPFGAPAYFAEADAVWDYGQGVIHVRGTDDGPISSISISAEWPSGLDVRPWIFRRDTWHRNR